MRTTTRRPAATATGAPVGVVTVLSARPGSEITHETLSPVRDNGGGVAVIRMAVPGRRDTGHAARAETRAARRAERGRPPRRPRRQPTGRLPRSADVRHP